jgi:hypothetical protein
MGSQDLERFKLFEKIKSKKKTQAGEQCHSSNAWVYDYTADY